MTYLDLLHYVALITGILAIVLGVVAIFIPVRMSKGFGIPVEGKPSAYISSLGVRDIFIGFVLLMLYQESAWTQIGYLSFMVSIVALVDFVVVYRNGLKRTSITHLIGTVLFVIYGILILKS
jgi:hypothetical protein